MKKDGVIYKCSCGYSNSKAFWVCPKCGNSDISEEIVSNIQSTTTKSSSKAVASKEASIKISNKIKRVKDNVDDLKYSVIKTCNFKELDSILSTDNGILEGQVVLLSASPGVGKSTLCCELCDDESLYISTEETSKQVNNRFKRVNPNVNPYLLSTIDEEEIITAIIKTDAKFIILDSLNSIENGTLSYVRMSQVAQKITNIVKETGKSIIIISQVSKTGNVIGMESLVHCVDTVLHMEKSNISENIILSSSKNRFAEAGNICLFRHRDNGLEEVEQLLTDEENMIGTTRFFMVAGCKKIPMEIQCLITETDDKPIRRAIGIDFNKLYLINAILSCNDSYYNIRTSDISLSTSNGLRLSDGNDLAIANSMLSSYYNLYIDLDMNYFEGMLNLNGSISGNKKMKHINELIDLYRKKNKEGR